MKKGFLRRFLSASLLFAVALTFNFIDCSNSVQAKEKNEEKVFIKHRDGSISNNYVTVRPIPNDFDAINATDEELEYYHLPKRPKDENKLPKWKKLV